jgi:hypothetical protein
MVDTTTEASVGFRRALGAIFVVAGILFAVFTSRVLLRAAAPLQDEALAGLLLALCLVFAGGLLAFPNGGAFQQRLLQVLLVTSMALLFDWVAFAPGPRQFATGASASHPGAAVKAKFGREVFAVGAVLMDLLACYLWSVTIAVLRPGSRDRRPVKEPSD